MPAIPTGCSDACTSWATFVLISATTEKGPAVRPGAGGSIRRWRRRENRLRKLRKMRKYPASSDQRMTGVRMTIVCMLTVRTNLGHSWLRKVGTLLLSTFILVIGVVYHAEAVEE